MPTGTCAPGATFARRCAPSASTASAIRKSRPHRSPITPGTSHLPEKLFEGSADDLLVTIDVASSALPLIADYIPDDTGSKKQGDRVRTTIRVSHYHGLKRLVASMPGLITVVEPAEARSVVAQWAAAGAARYPDPES